MLLTIRPMRTWLTALAITALLAVLRPELVQGQPVDRTWIGTAGSFAQATNWSPNGVPDFDDRVTIEGAAWPLIAANVGVHTTISDATVLNGGVINTTTGSLTVTGTTLISGRSHAGEFPPQASVTVGNSPTTVDFRTGYLNVEDGAQLKLNGGEARIDHIGVIDETSRIVGTGYIRLMGSDPANRLINNGTIRSEGGIVLWAEIGTTASIDLDGDSGQGHLDLTTPSSNLQVISQVFEPFNGSMSVGSSFARFSLGDWLLGSEGTIDLLGGTAGRSVLSGKTTLEGNVQVHGAAFLEQPAIRSGAQIVVAPTGQLEIQTVREFSGGVIELQDAPLSLVNPNANFGGTLRMVDDPGTTANPEITGNAFTLSGNLEVIGRGSIWSLPQVTIAPTATIDVTPGGRLDFRYLNVQGGTFNALGDIYATGAVLSGVIQGERAVYRMASITYVGDTEVRARIASVSGEIERDVSVLVTSEWIGYHPTTGPTNRGGFTMKSGSELTISRPGGSWTLTSLSFEDETGTSAPPRVAGDPITLEGWIYLDGTQARIDADVDFRPESLVAFNNSATLLLGGSSLIRGNAWGDEGRVVNQGAFWVESDTVMEVGLRNESLMAFGQSNGPTAQLQVDTWEQTAGAELRVRLSAQGHDALRVEGLAALDGTLAVSYVDGFGPSPGDVFYVLTYGDLDGAFDEHQGLEFGAGAGEFLQPIYGEAGLALYRPLVGDANFDGMVSGADFTVWSDHFGQFGGWAQGDFNGDGRMTGADFTLWSDHFGQHVSFEPPPRATSVPEPMSAALSGIGLVGLGVWRYRGRRRLA